MRKTVQKRHPCASERVSGKALSAAFLCEVLLHGGVDAARDADSHRDADLLEFALFPTGDLTADQQFRVEEVYDSLSLFRICYIFRQYVLLR